MPAPSQRSTTAVATRPTPSRHVSPISSGIRETSSLHAEIHTVLTWEKLRSEFGTGQVLQRPVDAAQAVGDAVLLRQGPRVVLHAFVRRQVPIGTRALGSCSLGMPFQLLGEPGRRLLEIPPAAGQILQIQADPLGV